MNQLLWLIAFALVAVLAGLPLAYANQQVSVALAAKHNVSASQAHSHRHHRPGKRYSKATLSAFQPLRDPHAKHDHQASLVHQTIRMGAPARPTVVPASLHYQPIAIAIIKPGFFEDLGAALLETESSSETETVALASDSNGLGQEPVSVIDRYNNNSSSSDLSIGAMRLRLRHQGVMASVLIPIAEP